jgi:TonB family protein
VPYWQEAVILGGLDKQVMDEVVWGHADGIRACVRDNAASGAARGGLLAVKFKVSKNGRVTGAEVRTTTVGSRAVEQCVVEQFESMEFRAPKGGGTVIATYSMILTPVP